MATAYGAPAPASASASAPAKKSRNVVLFQPKLKSLELAHVSRQLATFLRAGVPILTGLEILAMDDSTPAATRVLTAIASDLRDGVTISEAFDRHPRDLPLLYRRMLRSAELTGDLDGVLDTLASYLERDADTKRKVMAALLYPGIVVGMAVLTVVILSLFVLPQFQKFFESLKTELPPATRALIAVTDWVGTYGAQAVALGVVMLVGGLLAQRTTRGKRTKDRLVLRLPIVGRIARLVAYERFCRLMASLTSGGVSLVTALSVAVAAIGNSVFADALIEVRRRVSEGEGIAVPIAATGLFPATLVQMIRVGESTGSVDKQFDVSAEYFRAELHHRLTKVTTLIEPIVVSVVGVIVGFVALALVSAMYGIFKQNGGA